jgi:four helix bundle protein
MAGGNREWRMDSENVIEARSIVRVKDPERRSISLQNCKPKEEQFTLITELGRASISVCSNLAEAAARQSSKEKKRFMK